jgi:hypothetical protein
LPRQSVPEARPLRCHELLVGVLELTARLAEIEGMLGDLATARKVVLGLGDGEPVPTTRPCLPDVPAFSPS